MAVSVTGSARSVADITLRLTPRLSRWIQTQMTDDEDHDLSLRQLSALQYIDGSETTLGDVARSLNVTPAVVTGLIDRLERRGYVRRVASQFDRRRVHIELTTAGEDIRDQAEDQLAASLETLMASLSPDEIDRLEDGLQVLDKVISTMTPRRGKSAAAKSGFDS